MRITGGQFRGRSIRPPGNLSVRPTTDFAKTALFNILNNHFDFSSINVLDIFAGTGSITFEFLSRGTSDMTCVDEDSRCISFIKKMSGELGSGNVKCIRSDAFKFLNHASQQWDIIFADPPFELDSTDLLPDLVFEKKLLREDGMIIIEHQSNRTLNSAAIPFDIRKYSNCSFSFYRNA